MILSTVRAPGGVYTGKLGHGTQMVNVITA
jgi:hypothetical protein